VAEHQISGQRWADGTTVSVYPAEAWANKSAAPSGSAVTSGVVASGAVSFTGLTDRVRYVAYAGGVGVGFVAQGLRDAALPDRARIEALEVGTVRQDASNTLTAPFGDFAPGSPYRPQLEIWPDSTEPYAGRAEIHLHGRDGNSADLQRKHAGFRLWTSDDDEADASLRAHIHDAAGPGGEQHHFQLHTKDASGELADRWFVGIGEDIAEMRLSSVRVSLHDDAYWTGTTDTDNERIWMKGRPFIECANADMAFKQSGDAKIVRFGRVTVGGPVVVRPESGSEAASGFAVQDTAGADYFAIEQAAATRGRMKYGYTTSFSASAGANHTVPTICDRYIEINTAAGPRKVACFLV
jgi:hypothetical protein